MLHPKNDARRSQNLVQSVVNEQDYSKEVLFEERDVDWMNTEFTWWQLGKQVPWSGRPHAR
jgi:hypothetical protein